MAKTKELTTVELNPVYSKFLTYLTDPSSDTFGNYTKSGIKAGLSRKYSENILNKKPKWFTEWMREFGGDLRRLEKAEKVFDDVLNLDHVEDAIGAFGVIINKETGLPYKKINTQIVKEKVSVSKFMGETIGRNKYSKKIEIVGGFSNDEVKDYD